MDGLHLLGEIKQRRPDLPVMMVTAYDDEERRSRANELGAFEFITKPVDFDREARRPGIVKLLGALVIKAFARAIGASWTKSLRPAVFDNVMGRADDEELRLGRREIYVRYGAGCWDREFADSPLEGNGFELPVPREIGSVSTLGEE
jgi:CheY-like chemotaxis protein